MQMDDQIVRAVAKLRAAVYGTSETPWSLVDGVVKSKHGTTVLTAGPGLTGGPNAAFTTVLNPQVAVEVSHLMLDVMNNSGPQSSAYLTCRAVAAVILEEF